MKLINADILSDINPDIITIILNGANCQHIMGGGVAKYLRDKFPVVYDADCKTVKGDISKLGNISHARVAKNMWVVNCYTQCNINSTRDVNYEALYSCLLRVKNNIDKFIAKGNDVNLRSPQIGCGLAGGEWGIVEQMYDFLLPDANVYYI